MQRRFRQSLVDVGGHEAVVGLVGYLCPRRGVIAAGVYFGVGLRSFGVRSKK